MNSKQFDVLVGLMRGDPESAANMAARSVDAFIKNLRLAAEECLELLK